MIASNHLGRRSWKPLGSQQYLGSVSVDLLGSPNPHWQVLIFSHFGFQTSLLNLLPLFGSVRRWREAPAWVYTCRYRTCHSLMGLRWIATLALGLTVVVLWARIPLSGLGKSLPLNLPTYADVMRNEHWKRSWIPGEHLPLSYSLVIHMSFRFLDPS